MFPFSRFTRYFLEVTQHRSIRRAAEVLHVSASAIDRQILKVEEELGVPLFERLPSGLRLTSAGELVLANARQWQKEYARTREQIDEMQGATLASRRSAHEFEHILSATDGHSPILIRPRT